MRKVRAILFCLALAALLSSCQLQDAQNGATPVTTGAGKEPAAETATAVAESLPEGYTEVSGPEEIEAQLGFSIGLPQKATVGAYGVVEGKYAYVTFAFEGKDYRYCAGRDIEDGQEGSPDYAHQEQASWLDYPYEVAWNDDGSGCAQWADEQTHIDYRLTAGSGAGRDAIGELAVLLLPAA